MSAAAHSQAQRQYGNKWRTIVDEYLPWRSPNDLKNYCNQYILGKGSHVRYCSCACADTDLQEGIFSHQRSGSITNDPHYMSHACYGFKKASNA